MESIELEEYMDELVMVSFRVTRLQREAIVIAARRARCVTVSEWLRRAVLERLSEEDLKLAEQSLRRQLQQSSSRSRRWLGLL